ncbi:hypothetical protein CR513_14954, partial [Mucuna pruriens]
MSQKGLLNERNQYIWIFVLDIKTKESLWKEALKTVVYILNKLTKPLMNFGLAKSQTSNTYIFGVVQLKHDLIGRMKENWIQEQLAIILLAMLNALGAISFMIPTSRSFFEMGNTIFLEEVEFEKKENIRNVVFEEESVNDIGQVLMPITIQETTPVIGDNVQTIVPNIVPKQDYDEVLPQTLIEQPQQPQEVPLKRSIRERRHAIPYDIVFLQEHDDDIGLTKDDPINFFQAMQSSNSQKWINIMKDEMKSM